jgi:hypothetical protein
MKKFLLIPVLCTSLFFGCGNGGENKQEASKDTTKTEANAPSKTSEASGDALTRMQGKWQSVDDAKNVIEIKGNKMTTIYDNDTKNVSVEDIDFSQNCQKECSMNGDIDLKGTTCFMTKGQFDASCFNLDHLDDKTLEYSMIGGTGKPLRFKKI